VVNSDSIGEKMMANTLLLRKLLLEARANLKRGRLLDDAFDA
jgi:hypothetical protein